MPEGDAFQGRIIVLSRKNEIAVPVGLTRIEACWAALWYLEKGYSGVVNRGRLIFITCSLALYSQSTLTIPLQTRSKLSHVTPT